MKQVRTQQQWARDLMCNIIMLMHKNDYNGDLCSVGYRYTINGAIDNYSQTFWDEKEHKNVSMFHRYEKFDAGIYKNVLLSKNAYDLMLEYTNKKKTINESDLDKSTKKVKLSQLSEEYNLNKKLHGEHLTPQSYTRIILNEVFKQTLKQSRIDETALKERVDYAFSDAKLSIITKEESLILDGKGSIYSAKEIESFLSEYSKIYKDLPEYIKNDYRALEGKHKDRSGFGAIRLYLLIARGVVFVNDKGQTKTFAECMEYLKDENYTVWG